MKKKQIVFVEPKLSISGYKMARALRLTGRYETILICFSKADKEFMKNAFDKIIYYELDLSPSPKNLLKLISNFTKKEIYGFFKHIRNLNPYIVQVRGPSIHTPICLFLFRKHPRILYLQDIWQYYGAKFTLERGEGVMQPFNAIFEKMGMRMCEGILNRWGENSLDPIKNKIKVPVQDFLTFCLDEIVQPPQGNKPKKEIELVYAGCIWYKWKGHPEFTDIIKSITVQKMHLHLYISNKVNPNLKKELDELSKTNKYFHFHERVDEDKINKEISKYDFSIHFDNYEYNINPLWYELGVSAKLFGYIEAGLPIIINKQFSIPLKIIERNNIGFGIKFSDLNKLREKIKEYKYPSKTEIAKAQENLLINRNIPVLEKFYDKIRNIKR